MSSTSVGIESLPLPIVVVDANGTIVEANRNAIDRIFSSTEYVAGTTALSALVGADAVPVPLTIKSDLARVRKVHGVTPAGSRFSAELSLAASGESRFAVVFNNVLSCDERQRQPHNRSGLELPLLEAVFETVLSPVLVLRADWRIAAVNSATLRVFGCSDPSHLIGQSIALLLPNEPLHAARPSGTSSVVGRRLDGSTCDLTMHLSPIGETFDVVQGDGADSSDDNDRLLHVAAFVDLTEMVQASSVARAKAAFLANMSHEVRTPMNGVVGLLEVLRDTPLSTMQRESVDMCQRAAQALVRVLDDVLLFSKLDSGKLRVINAPFTLLDVVEDVAQLFYPRVAQKRLSLVVDVDVALPRTFVGDSGRLHQILTNLVGNAVKFTEHGLVCIAVGRVPERGDGICFQVEDTGVGIDPDLLRTKLFRPFSQGDDDTARAHEGTGLGLVICKSLVELMGGADIKVESRVGRGSTFSFVLPLAVAPDAAPPLDVKNIAGKHVLVIDESAANRVVLRKLLQFYGAVVGEASSSALGFEAAKGAAFTQQPYDVIVIDLTQKTTGDEFVNALRASRLLSNTPVFVLSSMGGATVLDESLVDAIDVKPVRRARFLQTLDQLLAKNPSRSRRRSSVVDFGSPTARPRSGVNSDAHFLVGRSVLVVEDNNVNRVVLTRMLATAQCKVEGAANGVEAIEKASAKSFEIILTDIHMPVLDGIDAAKAIRVQRAERRLPQCCIVAVTADTSEHTRERCKAVGMDAVLFKPVTFASLVACLAPLLAARDAAAVEAAAAASTSLIGSGGGSSGSLTGSGSRQRLSAVVDIASTPPRAAPAADDARPLLYVVEDDVVTQTVLKVSLGRHLKQWRWQLFGTCEAMLAALTPAPSGHPLVVLSDIHLGPGMDGIDACKALRGRDYSGALMLMTASVDTAKIAARVRQYDCAGVFAKPLPIEELVRVCDEVLRRRESGDDDEPALDDSATDALVELMGSHVEGGANILDELCIDFDANLARLRQAVIMSNEPQVRQLVHDMRGVVSHVGAARLIELLYAVRAQSMKGNFDRSLIDDVTREWRRVSEAIRARARRQSAST
jgi:signal transduction histidine kinase/DNA-binding response OmpR family regulator